MKLDDIQCNMLYVHGRVVGEMAVRNGIFLLNLNLLPSVTNFHYA